MEVIVDQLNTVNLNSDIIKVNNPEKITHLVIKNYNKNTKWNNLENFSSVEVLQIDNCWVDNFNFFTSISKFQKLKTFKYNENCFFKRSDKKINIKFLKLNKITLIFNKKDDPDFSFLSLYDKENLSDNFINSFPNYPAAYQNINEIEFVNYEDFLEKVKEEDYDYLYTDISEGKNVFFNCDIYNLLRLKNLKNIKFCETDKELFNKKKIIEKILSFPNTNKLTINNNNLQNIRDKLIQARTLVLNFKYLPSEEKNLTNVNKHSTIKDALEVHWPSQYHNGYSKLFDEVLKSKIDHVIISPTEDFFNEYFEYYEGSVDFLKDELTKNKSIKKITFEFFEKEDSSWQYYDRSYYREFYYIFKKIIDKKIKIEINFKDIKIESDLDERFEKYIEFFYFYINCQTKNEYKNYFEIKNIKLKQIQKYVENLFFNKLKTIIVFDDQSNSKTLKKFKDIELIEAFLDDFYNFKIFEQDIDFEKFNKTKSEESFLDHFEYGFFKNWTIEDFEKNPGGCIPIIKKSFLDNSKKIIFNSLDNIFFQYIGKKPYDNYEKIFKSKVFHFPKSINYKDLKKLSVHDNPPISLNDLGFLKNLETLNFENYINQNDPECWYFPKFEKLINLDISTLHPFMIKHEPKGDNTKLVKNIHSSEKLENIKLSIGVTYNYEDTQWNTTDVDLTGFKNLQFLKKLEINRIDQTLIKKLENLESLEELDISNPFMITKEMGSYDGTIQEPLTEKDFEFIKNSKKLKKINVLFPRNAWQGHKINVDFDKFLSFVNPSIDQIKIMVGFEKEKLKLTTSLFDRIINNYKNIKYIELDIDCLNAPENKNEYSNEENSPYKKEIKKREKNAKNPVYVDFRKLLNLKELKTVSLNLDENVGTRLLNVNEIINHKNLKDIRIDKDKFDTKDIEKMFEIIGTPREKYLLKYNKKNSGEAIYYSHKMDEKSRKEYNEIEEVDENTIEIDGSYLLNILVDRYKKNEKNTK